MEKKKQSISNQEREQREILEIDSKGVVVNYVEDEIVYRCVLFEDNVWIGTKALSSLLKTTPEKFNEIVERLYKSGNLPDDACRHYYYDGNNQSYHNKEYNHYSIEGCEAISVAMKSFLLIKYLSWCRKYIVKYCKNDVLTEGLQQNTFVEIRTYHHYKHDVVVPHQHNCYELVFYLSGKGKTASEYGNFNYEPNTIALIQPKIRHEEYNIEAGDCVCLTFFSEVALPTTVFLPEQKLYATIISIRDILSRMVASFSQENVGRDSKHDNENDVILVIFLLQKLIQLSCKKSADIDPIIQYLKKYFENNFSYKINFNILSETIGYSPNHLNFLFKKYVGQTMYAYLIDIRIMKAKEMLINSNAKVEKICKKCGFSSAARFSRFFKEKTGVSPSQYRKISRKQVVGGVISTWG